MQPLNNVYAGSFTNSALVANMIRPDRAEEIFDYSGGYGVLEMLANILSPKPSTRVMGADPVTGQPGVFYQNLLGQWLVAASITNGGRQVLSPNTLKLTWTDPNYDNFINTDVISDGTPGGSNLGYVVAHAPGTVTIHTYGSNTTFTAAMFQQASYCVSWFPTQPQSGSVMPESRYMQPTLISNNTSLMRGAITLEKANMVDEWVKYQGKYFYTSQDVFLAREFLKDSDRKGIFDTRGNQVINGKPVASSMGWIQSIQDPLRGGSTFSATNLLNDADYDYIVGSVAFLTNTAKRSVTTICGTGFLAAVQNLPGVLAMMVHTGVYNTLGGSSVKGFDVYELTKNGITNKFIVMPYWDNALEFPQPTILGSQFRRRQYDAIIFNSDMQTVDGKSVPCIEKKHFGESEIYYDILGGVAQDKGMFSSPQAQMSLVATNGSDAVTFSLYKNACYNFLSRYHLYYSLAY